MTAPDDQPSSAPDDEDPNALIAEMQELTAQIENEVQDVPSEQTES